MNVRFKSDTKDKLAKELAGQVGEVTATETRDKAQYVTVQFDGVEANGLPLDMFEFVE